MASIIRRSTSIGLLHSSRPVLVSSRLAPRIVAFHASARNQILKPLPRELHTLALQTFWRHMKPYWLKKHGLELEAKALFNITEVVQGTSKFPSELDFPTHTWSRPATVFSAMYRPYIDCSSVDGNLSLDWPSLPLQQMIRRQSLTIHLRTEVTTGHLRGISCQIVVVTFNLS